VRCSLFEVLLSYSLNRLPIVPIDDLRDKLARAYADKGQFTLMDPDDSVNALRALLAAVHSSAVGDKSQGLDPAAEEVRCVPPCAAHQVFALEVIQQRVCDCGGSSEASPWSYSSFTLPCYVSQLLQEYSRNMTYLTSISDRNLGAQVSASNVVRCKGSLMTYIMQSLKENLLQCAAEDPNCTSKNSRNESYLVNTPDVISINLTWPSSLPLPSDILKVIAAIPDSFDVADVIHTSNGIYHIYGFIVYGLAHYMGVFLDTATGQWILHDDTVQRGLGDMGNLYDMVVTCVQSSFYPVLILYKRSNFVRMPDSEILDIDWVKLERWAVYHDMHVNEDIELMRILEESRKTDSESTAPLGSEAPQFSYLDQNAQGQGAISESMVCLICKRELTDVELTGVVSEGTGDFYCNRCKPVVV
jgi:hypothetical protein